MLFYLKISMPGEVWNGPYLRFSWCAGGEHHHTLSLTLAAKKDGVQSIDSNSAASISFNNIIP